MQDTELMKKCLEDAEVLLADFMGWELGKVKAYIENVEITVRMATELFRYRSTQFTTEIIMEGEEVDEQVPY